MDIRFSTDMQSTKDTKYTFNKSDKLPYKLCSKFTICLFAFFLCGITIQSNKKTTGNQLFKKTKSKFFWNGLVNEQIKCLK